MSRKSKHLPENPDIDEDNLTASEHQPVEPEAEEQPEEKEQEQPEDKHPEHNPLNTNIDSLLIRLIQLQETAIKNQVVLDGNIKELNGNVVQMGKNLVEGYKATESTLEKTLSPLVQGLTNLPKQPQPNQQPQQNQQYFDPKLASLPNQQQVAGVPAQLDPNIVMHLIDKMLAPDQSTNIFNQLGQRAFADMATEQMYMRRAQYRQMQKQGWLADEEANAAIESQKKMYAPLLGQEGNKPNGQSATNTQTSQ